jgi:ABC-2 type transport system permease protein
MSAIIMMIYPSIDAAEQLEALFEQMPPAIQAMIGDEIDLSTAAGYLDLRMFSSIAPIIFLVYAIGRGNSAISAEERRGTMDLLLANPVQRWRIVTENAISMAAGLLVVGLALWTGLIAGGALMDVDFSFVRAGQATLMSALLGLVFGTLALAIGSLTGKPGETIGVTAGAAIALFFLHSLAPLVDWLEPYRILSPFYFATGHSVMLQGFKASYSFTLVLISITLVILSVIAFNRRDVQV